jgi:hypothetical protein
VLRGHSESLELDPAKVGENKIYWLKDGKYVKFGQKDWLELQGGRVKL